MLNRKFFGYLLSCALVLGIISSPAFPIFASDENIEPQTVFQQRKGQVQKNPTQVQHCLTMQSPTQNPNAFLRKNCNIEQKPQLNCFDDETRTQIQAIYEQLQNGTITTDEARAKLDDLGVQFPRKGKGNNRAVNCPIGEVFQ